MTTNHSLDRAKERLNLNSKAAKRNIYNAYERGQTAESFKSRERDYLTSKCSDGVVAYVYQNNCYIFKTDGTCLTVYPLPVWFGKKMDNKEKVRIRNYKKYYKFNMIKCA